MNQKSAWVFLFLFILTIILRKLGVSLNSILIISSTTILGCFIISKPVFFLKIYQRILALLFLILSLLILQYWIQNNNLDIIGGISLFLIILLGWIVFLILSSKNIFKNSLAIAFCFVISFILITSVILNPREFHNLYRSTTYEDYIRSKFPEQSSVLADYFIDKYKNVDKEKSDKFLQDAITTDSLGESEDALILFNKSIDLNPDNSFAYYRRGLLKLTRLELTYFIARSSVKDFNRAIRLDSSYSAAYFHRYLALSYLRDSKRSMNDLKKVWDLDSLIPEEEFQKRYGCSKKSFSIPFHP